MTTPRPNDLSRIRILSLDGGGIYGLTGAIWLRQLCEGNPRFLDGADIDLFAGCSSGAINALLLARHERPREAVLAGELERFWLQHAPFGQSRPLHRVMSWFGRAGWFSDIDLLRALHEQFGDMHLGDLPHHVHISTFNWTGGPGKPRRSRAGQETRHWRPKFFHNTFEDDWDFDDPVAEIAYAAATPPMFRPMRNGLGDGASFNGNPVVSAIAHVVRSHRLEEDGEVRVVRSRVAARAARRTGTHTAAILDRIAVLSLGSGQHLPHYAFSDANLGLMFSVLPSNPLAGVMWPPLAYAVDPATEEAAFIAEHLIGRHRSLRLNPATIPLPTIVASLLARNPLMYRMIVQQIYQATASEETRRAIHATLEFMASPDGWNYGVPPPSDPA